MEPVVTPAEMAAIDAEAPEPVEELIERAAWAVATQAAVMLGGSPYGKRIAILAGTGNNGADGRLAAPHLERRGARCTIFDIGRGSTAVVSSRHLTFDLIIDACFGTGLKRDFDADDLPLTIGETPVLAVDIPSGIDGLTGAERGRAIPATHTITFAAAKPGLLFHPGRSYAGVVSVADIGLDCSRATISHLHLRDLADAEHGWPRRTVNGHKWRQAVMVIGGSPGMTGAPALSSTGAFRAGAGYVTQCIPGTLGSSSVAAEPREAVQKPVSLEWSSEVLNGIERHGAAVVGPGLSATVAGGEQVARYVAETTTPTVFDAGALTSLAERGDLGIGDVEAVFSASPMTHVLTPHDGEFARLSGAAPGEDRVTAVRSLAANLGAVILLKGPTTVVADPSGRVLLSTAGDERLATAGTGDVLAGIIAAGLAGGLAPLLAAGLGAELHGQAAQRCRSVGMTALDLAPAVSAVLSGLRRQSPAEPPAGS